MPRYAENTTVGSEASRNEIERTLTRYGATEFLYGRSTDVAMIGFVMRDRQVKFTLTLPPVEDFKYTPSRGFERSAKDQQAEWEKACRQRWRALALVVKAKLEAVEAGITTFEDEFLAATVLPNGSTVGQWAHEQIVQAYQKNQMPALLPGVQRALSSGK